MPDPQLLAEALAILLAPVLPALVGAGGKAAGKAVEEAGKQAGAAVSGKVKEIWDRLRGKVEAKEAAREAVEDLAEKPDDQDLQIVFRRQLLKILTADPALAALLQPLADEARTEITVARVQAGDGSAAVGRDVHGNVIIHNTTVTAPAPPPDRTGPDALRRAYLKWLMEQVGVLSLAGIDPAALSEDALIAAMAEHPIIVERPIVVSGAKAALGRPPEKVLEVL